MLSEYVNILHLEKHLNAHNCNGYSSPGSWADSGTDMSADTPAQMELKEISENTSSHGNNIILQQVLWKHSSAPNKAAPKQQLQHLKSGFISSQKLQIIFKLPLSVPELHSHLAHEHDFLELMIFLKPNFCLSSRIYSPLFIALPIPQTIRWQRKEGGISGWCLFPAWWALLLSGTLQAGWHHKVGMICSTRGLQKPQAIVRSLGFLLEPTELFPNLLLWQTAAR